MINHRPDYLAEEDMSAFPPWSSWRLLLWLCVSILLSILCGSIIGITYSVLVVREGAAAIGMEIVSFVYPFAMSGFLFLRIRRTSNTFNHLVALPTQRLALVFSAVIGVSFIFARDQAPSTDWSAGLLGMGDFKLSSIVVQSILIAPPFEEFFFRGLLFNSAKRDYGLIAGAVISSVVFSLYHVDLGVPPMMIFSAFCLGLVACLLAHRTKSLLSPMVFHLSANLANYIVNIR